METRSILTRIHLFLTPVYDWRDNSLRQQILANYRRLLSKRTMGALLFLFKAATLLTLNFIFYIPGILLSLSGYRVLCVDLSQIGSISYLDAKIKQATLEHPGRRFIVPINPFWDKNNKPLLELYRPYVRYAESITAKLLLAPFYYNHFFAMNTKDIDGRDTIDYLIIGEYEDKISNEPLVSLSKEDLQACRAELDELGVGDTFVALHVRDSGFYGESWDSMRNADIDSYYDAVEFLVESGYRVLRLGSPDAKLPNERFSSLGHGFLDYARSSIKSERMDLYLLSQARFVFCTASGPLHAASVFHTPTLVTNHVSPADSLHLHAHDFSIFKKYVQEDGQYVNLIHLFSPSLRYNPTANFLSTHGISVVDNTPREILEAVKEFCQRRSNPYLPTPLNNKLRSTTKRMIPDAPWPPGRYCESFLQDYIKKQSQF